MPWSSKSVLPSQNCDAHFSCCQKKMVLMIFNDFDNFMVFGPKAPGAHGTLHFLRFFENVFYGLGPI